LLEVDPADDGFSQELSLRNNSGEPLAFKVRMLCLES
jgi:hypothetical protein